MPHLSHSGPLCPDGEDNDQTLRPEGRHFFVMCLYDAKHNDEAPQYWG